MYKDPKGARAVYVYMGMYIKEGINRRRMCLVVLRMIVRYIIEQLLKAPEDKDTSNAQDSQEAST